MRLIESSDREMQGAAEQRDFLVPYTLAEGKAYIDRTRALRILNDHEGDDATDLALLHLSLMKLDDGLLDHRRLIGTLSRLGSTIREFPIADGWFVPIAPRAKKPCYATLCRRVGPMKARDAMHGASMCARELLRIAHNAYPEDPDKKTGYCGLMLYRVNDAVWWIDLLGKSARVRHPYLVDQLAVGV